MKPPEYLVITKKTSYSMITINHPIGGEAYAGITKSIIYLHNNTIQFLIVP